MVALLRRGTDAAAEQLKVRFGSDSDVQLELTGPNGTILDGAWQGMPAFQGKALKAEAIWEEVCWHSDEDVDYLEIQQTLSGGWKRQRQFLLARRDRFLFLAEAVLSENTSGAKPTNGLKLTNGARVPSNLKSRIDYEGKLQLGAGAAFFGAPETHEGLLRRGKKTLAIVIPPGLPEWRADHFPGKLAAEEDQLVFGLAAEGANLYAPLFIDLEPTRFRQLVTWRRLTVGENLEIVPRDVAVSYRVQNGMQQWMFYRALAGRGNRTCLGYNTSYEFACQRFLPNGTLDTVLEIE